MALGEGEMFGRTSAPVKYMHLNGQLVEMTYAVALRCYIHCKVMS